MSDHEINVAVAEAIGMRVYEEEDGSGLWSATGRLGGFRVGLNKDHAEKVCYPHFCGDLNAMHEAEKSLTQEQLATYSAFVGVLAISHLPMSRAVLMDFKMIHASARQRAEAFLRTVGKWKEAKP